MQLSTMHIHTYYNESFQIPASRGDPSGLHRFSLWPSRRQIIFLRRKIMQESPSKAEK